MQFKRQLQVVGEALRDRHGPDIKKVPGGRLLPDGTTLLILKTAPSDADIKTLIAEVATGERGPTRILCFETVSLTEAQQKFLTAESVASLLAEAFSKAGSEGEDGGEG